MENDIAAVQRSGAFHAASAMECVVKGDLAHLKMAVWHQNHAAYFYGNARRMLTAQIEALNFGDRGAQDERSIARDALAQVSLAEACAS